MSAPSRLSIDIGGTFTDLVVARGDRIVATRKQLTSPHDPIAAIIEGTQALLAEAEIDGGDIAEVLHGTTLVTNALIEQKGKPLVMLNTAGFRDVLEMGREARYDLYDVFLDPSPLLASRKDRLEVTERVDHSGAVLRTVDPREIGAIVRDLPDEVRSVAVCFLHSYANSENERAARDVISAERPDLNVSLSSEVAPEIREYERFTTTVANAYVQPIVRPYLEALSDRLSSAGIAGRLFILLSNGGLATIDSAARFPIRIAESGPAAGVLAAAMISRQVEADKLLAFDMGGTTAKASFIDDHLPALASQFEVARAYMFKPGSGIPLKIPSVELLEIGAGGGSIAAIDRLGLLKVGPQSAGAAPGPICYGNGGEDPTVTDADLLLGYLNPTYFLGGRMNLDRGKTQRLMEERIAAPAGLDLTEAAWGIHRVVNENMANAIRMHAAERGKDVRFYAMTAFGGAGSLHACHIAEAIGIRRVICPSEGSVLSACGLLAAPRSFDFVRSLHQRLDDLDIDRLNALFDEMLQEGRAVLANAGEDSETITAVRSVEMRFTGQGFDVEVEIPQGPLTPAARDQIVERFKRRYVELYHRLPGDLTIEAWTWRLRVIGQDAAFHIGGTNGHKAPAPAGSRPAFFQRTGTVSTPAYARQSLSVGDRIVGPALIDAPDTTVVVPPTWSATVDPNFNLVVER